jgi:membrane-associated phospholipid phosphatase
LRRRVAFGVLVAALLAGGVAATFVISFATDTGRRADAKVFERVGTHDAPDLRRLGRRIGGDRLNLAAAVGLIAAGTALTLLWLVGLTRLSGWVIALMVAGALVTTEGLKDFLADEGHELAPLRVPGTFPSGHATLALGIVLAVVMSIPQRHRAIATLGGSILAIVFGLLIVVGNLHPPSDVIGGYLVAAAWAALLTPFVHGTRGRPEIERRRIRGVLFAAMALPILLFVLLAGAYVEDVLGADRLLVALVAALSVVSTVLVALVGALADCSPAASTPQ